MLAEISECRLEIDEYYEDFKWINRYFVGKAVGQTKMRQTQREREAGMVPRWIPIDEAKAIFSAHAAYAGTDEMRRGMYLREITALNELL